MKNEILLEVWRNRDEFARRHKYNLDLMVKTLRRIERESRNPLVSQRRKPPAKRMRRQPHFRQR